MKPILLIFIATLSLFAADSKDVASFQTVWDTVHEKHWDLGATGVDWNSVYDEFKPKVEAAQSRGEVRALLKEMLGRLGQSHFRVLEAEGLSKLDALINRIGGGPDTPGFKAGIVDGRLFIVQIEDTQKASKFGLEVGQEILKLSGVPGTKVAQAVTEAHKDSVNAGLEMGRTLEMLVGGLRGSALRLDVLMNGKEVSLEIPFSKRPGKTMRLLNLPPFNYQYQSEILPGNLGYIYFNIFVLDSKLAFQQDLRGKLKDTDGLIIDLRGNPGGMGLLAAGMAGHLMKEKGRLGEMINSGGKFNFAVFPQKPIYDKPVAALIDGGSASTSEIFVAGLQDLGRARVFGTKSAGAALPSFIVDLPNGDRFQYAVGDYISVKGRHLEGIGVSPDEPTPHTLDSLARGVDPTMEAAKGWLKRKDY